MKKVSALIIFLLSLSIVSAVSVDEFQESYNVGDILTISGNGDGDSVDLTLTCNNEAVDLWDASIEGGLFRKEVEIDDDMVGTCYITAGIDGDTSNSNTFKVVEEAVAEEVVEDVAEEVAEPAPVINTIAITANLNKNIYDPGEKLIVSGAVDKENADVIVEIDGKQFVSEGKEFKIEYILPKDVKSGEHGLLVKAKDDYGNYGELSLKYSVDPIPTSLELTLAESYNPGDIVLVLTKVYDQAGGLISGKYTVYVYDGVTKVLVEEHSLGEEAKLKLGDFAKPGVRRVKVVAFNLNKEQDFIVNEVKKLDISLSGDILIIRNTGNVDFEEKLVIKGNEIIKERKLYLGLNEVDDVDLSSLFNEGIYNINIPLTGQRFEGVQVDKGGIFSGIGTGLNGVTGMTVFNVKKTYNNYGYFIVSGLILVVIILIFLNIKSRKNLVNRARAKEYMHGQKRLRELQRIKPGSRKYGYEFGKPGDEDVSYFRNKVVKDYQENERHERLYGRPKSDSSSGGLFNMFK